MKTIQKTAHFTSGGKRFSVTGVTSTEHALTLRKFLATAKLNADEENINYLIY